MGASTTTYKRAGAYVTDPVLNETTGQFSANYTPGVSERRAGVSTFLHSGLKNADARTTDGSSVTAERQYDAFGNLTGGNGTWNGPFGYAGGFGYQEDGESGLKLLGHRYYDSTTGRFLSKDPVRDGRNWTTYAHNNPVVTSDPDGLRPVTKADTARLHKLRKRMEDQGYDPAYINYITRLLKDHINRQPEWGDAPGMTALFAAIDRLGDASYGSAADGINKCNKFVYDMYLGIGLPMPDRTGRPGTQPYGANYIGEATELDHLFHVPTDQLLPGDILAFPKAGTGARASGHVTLVIGGGLLIYASDKDVKVGTFERNYAQNRGKPRGWRHRGRQ